MPHVAASASTPLPINNPPGPNNGAGPADTALAPNVLTDAAALNVFTDADRPDGTEPNTDGAEPNTDGTEPNTEGADGRCTPANADRTGSTDGTAAGSARPDTCRPVPTPPPSPRAPGRGTINPRRPPAESPPAESPPAEAAREPTPTPANARRTSSTPTP